LLPEKNIQPAGLKQLLIRKQLAGQIMRKRISPSFFMTAPFSLLPS
jgi:hypothetical protein